jgi:hypothetical protein
MISGTRNYRGKICSSLIVDKGRLTSPQSAINFFRKKFLKTHRDPLEHKDIYQGKNVLPGK